MPDNMIGEVEFFNMIKRVNRDLNSHERWVILTVTKEILLLKGKLRISDE